MTSFGTFSVVMPVTAAIGSIAGQAIATKGALRAIAAGYTNVMWYRGGIAAWLHAGFPMSQAEPFAW